MAGRKPLPRKTERQFIKAGWIAEASGCDQEGNIKFKLRVMEKKTLKERMSAAAGKAVKAAKTSAFLGVAGCILAGGIGFAEARHNASERQTMVKWARVDGAWVNINGQTQQTTPGGPGDYRCDSSVDICSAQFAEGVNPNQGGAIPSNVVEGEYVSLDD